MKKSRRSIYGVFLGSMGRVQLGRYAKGVSG